LRVRAIGINRSEINFRAGTNGQPPPLPAQLGFEAAGQIDALGPRVSAFSVGNAVSALPGFPSNQYGMYGDLVLAPARLLVKHPSNVAWEEAAATWMSCTTAWLGLVNYSRIERGDYVIINAASSSVGLSAIQVARRSGGIPITLARTPAKVEALKEAEQAM
jgi:NADPH:quinone reductase-like Zn-dependent oxidoreductase